MVIVDAFERFFYETECIKCNWSVRELRRQIKTNLYIRAGISKRPELLMTPSTDNMKASALSIKDPFTFKFTLRAKLFTIQKSNKFQACKESEST